MACKYGSKKGKVSFQLWSANIVFALIKVHQAKIFGFMFVGIFTGPQGSQEMLESGHCKYTTLDLLKVICLL